MFTIRPQPRSFMCGHTACAQLKPPERFTRRSRSQSSGLWSGNCADVVERARVVDEDVDGAEFLDRPRHCVRHLRAVRDVAAHRERATPERPDLLDRLLRVHHPLRARDGCERTPAVRLLGELRLDEDVGDRDVGTRTRERQRICAARARASRP